MQPNEERVKRGFFERFKRFISRIGYTLPQMRKITGELHNSQVRDLEDSVESRAGVLLPSFEAIDEKMIVKEGIPRPAATSNLTLNWLIGHVNKYILRNVLVTSGGIVGMVVGATMVTTAVALPYIGILAGIGIVIASAIGLAGVGLGIIGSRNLYKLFEEKGGLVKWGEAVEKGIGSDSYIQISQARGMQEKQNVGQAPRQGPQPKGKPASLVPPSPVMYGTGVPSAPSELNPEAEGTPAPKGYRKIE